MRPGAALLSWVAGLVTATVLSLVGTLALVGALREVPLDLLGLVLTVWAVLSTIVGVAVAVLVYGWAPPRATGAPWWRWLVVGLPVVVAVRVLGAAARALAPVEVGTDVLAEVLTLGAELLLGALAAVALGTWRTRVADRRTAAVAAPSAH